jgi:hypothetical protein
MVQEEIVAVAGMTRSGTSMLMTMLRAGGMHLFYDEGREWAWETSRVFQLPQDASWLQWARGSAVKLLDVQHYIPLPASERWRFILMRRDPAEQARSMVKFLRQLGGLDATNNAALAEGIRRDQKLSEKHLAKRGPVLRVAFEDVLKDPDREAERIGRFVGLDSTAQIESMADQVLERAPANYPGLLETQMERIHATAARYGVSPRFMWHRMLESA